MNYSLKVSSSVEAKPLNTIKLTCLKDSEVHVHVPKMLQTHKKIKWTKCLSNTKSASSIHNDKCFG